jgi:hypothetical protein
MDPSAVITVRLPLIYGPLQVYDERLPGPIPAAPDPLQAQNQAFVKLTVGSAPTSVAVAQNKGAVQSSAVAANAALSASTQSTGNGVDTYI